MEGEQPVGIEVTVTYRAMLGGTVLAAGLSQDYRPMAASPTHLPLRSTKASELQLLQLASSLCLSLTTSFLALRPWPSWLCHLCLV